jgi:hypothetical protein
MSEDAAAEAPAAAAGAIDSDEVAALLDRLIAAVGGDPETMEGRLVRDLLRAGLKLIPDRRDTGELKLITAAVKELRYAYRVFARYAAESKVSIFGSARTPADHPDYRAAVEFSRRMEAAGWMPITGAGSGIMQAGHEGPGREASFGLAIRLPLETRANEVIAGDEKLINFRYFFTRKLIFLSQCDAVAVFPGGFGTLDETFETLTLLQTGKGSFIPVVFLQGEGEHYWQDFEEFIRARLLPRGLISPQDLSLYHIARDPADAVDHITRFYRVYHSARYVRGDELVIRLHHALRESDVERLNEEFADLVARGRMRQRGPYPVEREHLDLPRLGFAHTRASYGRVRQLIDRINQCGPA